MKEKPQKGVKEKDKGKSATFACLGEEEMDPRNVEIPESGSNAACRHINLANVLGGNDWKRKKEMGRNVLASSIQDLAEGDSVASLF